MDSAAPPETAPSSAPQPTPAGPPPEAPDDLAATLERYEEAVRTGDAATICEDLLSTTVLERIEDVGGDCAEDFIPATLGDAAGDYELELLSVEVDGDRAVARARATTGGKTREDPQPLVREEGEWKLTLQPAADQP